MKVFLSYSGVRSCAVAESLNDWLPRVIQAVKPFFSPELEKGAKWYREVDGALEGSRFGIICLTPDNLTSEWIHFETGALSKTKDALIWTFLHGVGNADIPPPLGMFQHTLAEKADVFRLVRTINGRLAEDGGEPLQDKLLEDNFETFWPRLENNLKEAENLAVSVVPAKYSDELENPRAERALLEEILELLRTQERRLLEVEQRLLAVQGQPDASSVQGARSFNAIDIVPRSESLSDVAPKLTEVIERMAPGALVGVETEDEEEVLRIIFLNFYTKPVLDKLIEAVIRKAGVSGLDLRAFSIGEKPS